MLTAEKADEALLRGVRSDFCRPIHFERYKKPQVVEYPRHAVVLNPQHTRLQRDMATVSSGANGNENEEEDPLEKKKRLAAGKSPDDDDDDPRFADTSTFLCSDDQLRQWMQLQWKEMGPAGKGLENMGNTCFANAVLQAISYTPALAQYFAYYFKNADTQLGAPYDFAYALGETIRQVHLNSNNTRSGGFGGGGRSSYRPVAIMSHLRNLSSHFQLGRQCDAHEFAVQLLFAAQKSILFRHVGNTKLPHRVTTTTGLLRICGGFLLSQVSWSRQDEMEQLNKKGKKQAAADLKLEGGGDRMVSNTYDPMTILTVELAGQTLEHCLQKFCEKEKLDGRCYHTPRDVGVRAEKQFFIHMPPNVLVIQIKRFSPTGGKAGKMIRYPLELNLQPFCSPKAKLQPQWYTLHAVCVHQGHTINSGHYYSVVKARNGSWHECNDSMVRMISEDKALQQEAYMLFYSRKVSTLDTPAAAAPSRGPAASVPLTTSPTLSPAAARLGPSVVMKSYPSALPLPGQQGYPQGGEEEEGLGEVISDEAARAWIHNNNNKNNKDRSSLKRRGSSSSSSSDKENGAEDDVLATSSPKQRQREERTEPEPSAPRPPAWRSSAQARTGTTSWPPTAQRRSPGIDGALYNNNNNNDNNNNLISSSASLSLTGVGRESTSRTLSPTSTSSAPVGGYFATMPGAGRQHAAGGKSRLPPLPHDSLHTVHERQQQQEQAQEQAQHQLVSEREDPGVDPSREAMGMDVSGEGSSAASSLPPSVTGVKRTPANQTHYLGKRGLVRNHLIASRTAYTTNRNRGPNGMGVSKLLENQKKEAITLQRSDQMPKFQKKMRDPLWENSLDQGRVKKVKSGGQQPLDGGVYGEDSQTNRFQKAAEQKRKGGFASPRAGT